MLFRENRSLYLFCLRCCSKQAPKGISFLLSIMGAQVSEAEPLLPQLIPLFILLPAFTVSSAVTWTTFGVAIG